MPNYPARPLHRIDYTALSEAQITRALQATANGPANTSPLSGALSGQSMRIVTDEGPTLAYDFASANRLSLSEDGAGAAEAGYGAMELGHLLFVTHMLPGTQRGFNLIIDRDTNLVTVFEVWFSGFDALNSEQPWFEPGQYNREVQRQVWFGYVDAGGAAPEARHRRTNRVEGQGFYWKQDAGMETLDFYSSTFYTNFVELSRTGGEMGFCAPADYVWIDDETFVYSRTECEFSGTFTLYVYKPAASQQVGVRLGFDETDTLEYRLFRGEGEWLGQIARFEAFHDYDGAEMPEGKGARRVYRPMNTFQTLTAAEVDRVAAEDTHVFEPSAMAGNQQPSTGALAGKTMTMRWDNGRTVEYRFDGAEQLSWRPAGERGWRTEKYKAWEPSPNVFMFGHLMSGAPDHDAQIMVVDLDEGLATLLHGWVGSEYIANESQVKSVFGVVEMDGLTPPKYRRHRYTDEMLGRAITWEYSPGLTSMHLYSTPYSLSWIIPGANGSMGMQWSGPSEYVKIRDGLYLAYWLEEACNGTLGTLLVNLKTMHDCGIGLHCGPNGLSLSPVGAIARHAGRFDLAKYFPNET